MVFENLYKCCHKALFYCIFWTNSLFEWIEEQNGRGLDFFVKMYFLSEMVAVVTIQQSHSKSFSFNMLLVGYSTFTYQSFLKNHIKMVIFYAYFLRLFLWKRGDKENHNLFISIRTHTNWNRSLIERKNKEFFIHCVSLPICIIFSWKFYN